VCMVVCVSVCVHVCVSAHVPRLANSTILPLTTESRASAFQALASTTCVCVYVYYCLGVCVCVRACVSVFVCEIEFRCTYV